MPKSLRILTGLMAILFLAATAVQYNDPDPVRWMAIYGSASLVCILVLMGARQRILPAIVALAAIAWAATLWKDTWDNVGFGELVQNIRMETAAIEAGRELIGLMIVALWMIVLCFALGGKSKGG